MEPVLETARLILRPFALADAKAAFEWFGDPAVMRFTPTGPDKSMEDTLARLAGYQDHQSAHGFSKWMMVERGSGLPIGDSGLLRLKHHDWVDLGFRLAQPYWAKDSPRRPQAPG
jgi:[ribosomal protein S5]-alanine N-acetyltransferase